MASRNPLWARVFRTAPLLLVAGIALTGCASGSAVPGAAPSASAVLTPAGEGGDHPDQAHRGDRDRDQGSPIRHVEIRVSGDAPRALIRDFTVPESQNRRHLDDDVSDRENAAAATEQTLPWSTEFDLTLDANGDYQKVIVWAQNIPGNVGEVRCEIYVDGERKSHHDEDDNDPVSCDKKLDLD
ncbi:hypothetical protein M2390_002875 [Mycetocola sp. BIGb0189]|uniref:hypothetical protein n=1 Tax=Mycetocola sp. BIGb0189 TaxID=2940604 RepID=UPI00216A1877|nr:hypothetical protein [Mycetocola sp. BIGb0189]MCS4277666.1 hypothetical protein [Mycetocola sp. BIGb0189]